MTEAAVLALILTLLPGHRVEDARQLARDTLVKAGCADVRVSIRTKARTKVEVEATCARLGAPSAGTPEGAWRNVAP